MGTVRTDYFSVSSTHDRVSQLEQWAVGFLGRDVVVSATLSLGLTNVVAGYQQPYVTGPIIHLCTVSVRGGGRDAIHVNVSLNNAGARIVTLNSTKRRLCHRHLPAPHSSCQRAVRAVTALISVTRRTAKRHKAMNVNVPNSVSPCANIIGGTGSA